MLSLKTQPLCCKKSRQMVMPWHAPGDSPRWIPRQQSALIATHMSESSWTSSPVKPSDDHRIRYNKRYLPRWALPQPLTHKIMFSGSQFGDNILCSSRKPTHPPCSLPFKADLCGLLNLLAFNWVQPVETLTGNQREERDPSIEGCRLRSLWRTTLYTTLLLGSQISLPPLVPSALGE